MSWLRSAVSKAVAVGGSGNISRTVRNYADSVVEGAKLLQDRIAARNTKSFKLAVKRLEEVSVSCGGIERVQLLTRWLVALKEIERLCGSSVEIDGKSSEQPHMSTDLNDSPRKPTVVLYYDPDLGGEPMNFHDVFLHSQALEGMTMSMILEAPTEEEISLLKEIFGLCLSGGKEVHNAMVRSIEDLAKAFSSYDVEVLAKREELLQFAQGAISGLKVNADITRIDSEVSKIHQNLDRMRDQQPLSEGNENSSEAPTSAAAEVIKEPVAYIQLCSRLEALLLRKKILNNGDSPEIHAKKVDKLKILSESLVSSASKAEKRISDQRFQKEEALNFRVTRTSEVSQLEKELSTEIGVLEKKRDELEAELKKVNVSLAAANARRQNAKEERDQFDEASNQILEHFKMKEDELSKSIASYRAEADACNAFVSFLEATWVFQSSDMEQKEKQVNDELEKHEEYFENVVLRILSTYKDELEPLITSVRKLVEDLKRYEKATDPDHEKLQDPNRRENLEQEYVDTETKLITMFHQVESIKELFYNENKEVPRKGNERVKELCDAIEKIKSELESIERPTLFIETMTYRVETPRKETPDRSPSPTFKQAPVEEVQSNEGPNLDTETPKHKPEISLEDSSKKAPSQNLEKQNVEKMESEQRKISQPAASEDEKSSGPDKQLSEWALDSNKDIREQSKEEIGGREFDELEKELNI